MLLMVTTTTKEESLAQASLVHRLQTTIEDVLFVEGLKHSLLSISQLCDQGFKVNFTKDECLVENEVTHDVMLKGKIVNNIFQMSLDNLSLNVRCLLANNNESWLWHKRFARIYMEHLNKLIKHDLVIGLPKIKFIKDGLCGACQKGKKTKSTFISKNVVSTTRPLQLLHMDLFGPSRTKSFGGNIYAFYVESMTFFDFSTMYIIFHDMCF